MVFPLLALTLLLLPSLTNAATNESQSACQILRTGPLSALVDFPGSQLYETGARSAWSLQNEQLDPSCVVFPRTTQDVSVAMKAIFRAKARYAVQAAGHSAMQGWNNVEGGVLIHFADMKAITYNASTSSVTFQPGITWGEALDTLETHGVAVAGGRSSNVGTGLLLGGGLSHLASEYGFSSDTIREMDVVLVDGQVVTATVNRYSDLFRALKGSGNRFGIVTRYVVDAIPTGTKDDKNWFGGQLVYSNSSVDAVLRAVAHYPLQANDTKASMVVSFFNGFSNGTISPFISINAWYKGSELPDALFGEFKAIPTIQTDIAPRSYYEVANFIPDFGNVTAVIQLFGASVLEGSNDLQPYREIYALYARFCNEFRNELGGSALAFTAVPHSQIEAGRARGGNAIDAPRGGFYMIQFYISTREGAERVSPALEAARQKFFRTVPRTRGLPLYLGESDKNQQVFRTYGSYEFLKRTYKKYDPTRFNVRYSDGPSGL